AFHAGTNPGAVWLAADQFAPFDNVYVHSGSAPGGAARIFTDLPGSVFGIGPPTLQTLTITGSLNWQVANRLHIAASSIESATSIESGQPGSAVGLSAPYINLTGGGGLARAGNNSLTISSQTLDIEGATFSRFSQANLISSGDIRLSTQKVSNSVNT